MNHVRYFFVMTTLVLSLPFSTYAGAYDNCGGDCDPCKRGYFGIDFNFWQLCADNLEYGIRTSDVDITIPVGSANYKFIHHNWDPGFTVFAGVPNLCDSCWGLYGSYTRVTGNTTAKDSTSGNTGLYSTLAEFGLYELIFPLIPFAMDTKHSYSYQNVDVLLHFDLNLCGCHTFTPFFGLEGLKFDQEIKQQIDGVRLIFVGLATPNASAKKQIGEEEFARVKWNSDYEGIGFKFGSEYAYSICENLEFYAKGSGSVLVGDLENRNQQQRSFVTTPFTLTSNSKEVVQTKQLSSPYDYTYKTDECIFVTGYKIGLGIRYFKQCGCWDVTGHLGYDFLQWYNLGTPRRFTIDIFGDSTSPSRATVGFHGLVAGLAVNY